MAPIIDSNIIIHGRMKPGFDTVVTVPEVLEEMKSSEAKQRTNNLNIKVQEPSKESLKKVKKKSKEINSPTSDTDEKIIALGLDNKKTIISDDKAIQNLALHLDLDFKGYMEDKIEKKLEWETVCKNCGKKTSNPPCPNCGHRKLRHKAC